MQKPASRNDVFIPSSGSKSAPNTNASGYECLSKQCVITKQSRSTFDWVVLQSRSLSIKLALRGIACFIKRPVKKYLKVIAFYRLRDVMEILSVEIIISNGNC